MAPRIIQKGPGADELPPPGDERRDVLRARHDSLEEAAETAGLEGGTAALPAVESELAQHFDELAVEDADPAYAYCWVNSGFYGRFIKGKMSEGWEVVQGDMPEASRLRGMGADTTRRLGDVILMRMRRDRHVMLERLRHEAHRKQMDSTAAGLEDMSGQAAQYGARVYTNLASMPPHLQRRVMARQTAGRAVDRLIREGRMPGVPAPGA